MKQFDPPKLPLKFLRFFCADDRLEELEGDLYEVYNDFIVEKGNRFSNLFYWGIVIKSFRSYALKGNRMESRNRLSTALTFLKHNLTIAKRSIVKHKTTAAINIFGLAVGLAAFLSIYSIVQYELSFNKQIPEKENVYRIYSSFSGSFTASNKGVAIPIGDFVQENFTGLEAVSRFQTWSASVKIPDENELLRDLGGQGPMIIADSSYFKVIDQYEWIVGSPTESLNEPQRVVLTDNQARIYFGSIDWRDMIDRKIIYHDSLEVLVSGIVKQPDYNTDFDFTEIISYLTITNTWLKERYDLNLWDNTNSSSQLFIKKMANVDFDNINRQMIRIDEKILEQTEDTDWVQSYKLQSLGDLHYNPEIGIFDNSGPSVHLETLSILSIVAVAILLIAVFNFVNLETAQSTSKSKEVGVRKVMGSVRSQLIARFITESMVVAFIAVILAIPLAHYGLIYFQEFIPEGVKIEYESPLFWMFLLSIGLFVGFIAGIYPSLVVSSFNPIKALGSGVASSRAGGAFIRKSLILFQFLFSQLLIVGTLAMVWQISFMLDKELGFEEDGILYFYTPFYGSENDQNRLVNDIKSMPSVSNLSLHGNPPAQNGYSTSTVKYFTNGEEIVTSAHQKSGDTTYLRFYDIELVAGRNLLPNDTLSELLINETFMKELGFSDPRDAIGNSFEYNEKQHSISGVMKDFHFRSLHHEIEPLLYTYSDNNWCIALKTNLGSNLQQTIDDLTDKWNKIYTDRPLTVYFMDETIERFYKSERQASKLASVATGLAIFISCLGLFGLISFTILQKSKEMGIRKVLGASVLQIGSVISREFLLLIVLAFVISTPISYYLIQLWMTDFAYQTEISWWIFIVGGSASILIALISIGVKVWKASAANPIDSLKYE